MRLSCAGNARHAGQMGSSGLEGPLPARFAGGQRAIAEKKDDSFGIGYGVHARKRAG